MNNIKEYLLKELTKDETVVIATSGGPDSMVLLHLVIQLKEKLNLKIICAHVNHQLRKESNDEEVMVKDFCAKNSISCEIMTINHYEKGNTESQARVKRYEFFEKVVKNCQAKHLLTAHHGDDLTETILMRITRGSTLKGYQGFKEKIEKDNYIILRPLITKTKNQIEEYCIQNKIPYAIDKTNEEDTYTRNRYRKYILPRLKDEDKNVHQKFYKFSKTLELYNDFINKETQKQLEKVYKNKTLDLDKFIKLEQIIKIKIINQILENTYKENISLITDKHTDLILDLTNSKKPNQTIDLPENIKAIKSYNKLTIKKEETNENYKIKLETKTKLPNNKTIVIKTSSDLTNNNVTYLNTKELNLPLYIRNKQEGDKIAIKGLNGHKKIKDIFIDEKVSKTKRDSWPIVVDSKNNIIWIPGLKKSKFDKQKEQNYDIILEYI